MEITTPRSNDPNALPGCNLNRWHRFAEAPVLLESERHRQNQLQIQHDAPNLLWLYILIVDAGIGLPTGNIVAAMKARLLQEEPMSPTAWRFLANGSVLDFWVVLEATDPGDDITCRWNLLISWLHILSGLRLKERFLPVQLQQLFLNDSLLVNPDYDEVHLHGAWMSFGTLRSILKEAQRCLNCGNLDKFIENELPPVITWLAALDPFIDSNQRRSGWRFLANSAYMGRMTTDGRAIGEKQRWRSVVNDWTFGSWKCECITNAWELHQLSLSQRHCASRFLDGCLSDNERIFTVAGATGKIQATVRLSRNGAKWSATEIRGFANAQVSDDLTALGLELAAFYTAKWLQIDFHP